MRLVQEKAFKNEIRSICSGFPDREEWESFIHANEQSSMYHSPEFTDCLEASGIRVHCFQVRDKNSLRGLAIIVEDRFLPLSLLGAKGFCSAGFIFENADDHQLILSWLNKFFKWKILFLEVFDEGDNLDSARLAAGYRMDRHKNFLIDLSPGIEDIRANYKRALKRNLRRAEEFSLKYRIAKSQSDYKTAFHLLQETSKRVKAPELPWKLYRAVRKILVPRGMAKVYLAEVLVNGVPRIINSRVELYYNGTCIDWYTGSDTEYIHSQAGPWLVDKIIKDAAENGVKNFDFGGAGRVGENYGPAEFKRRFGGNEEVVTRYQKVFHPFLNAIARKGYNTLRSFFRFKTGH
jgi:serine/alanine adding enzyme